MRPAHVLQRRKARLAHHTLEQHAAGDRDDDVRGFEFFVGLSVVRGVQLGGERIAAKVVRIGLTTPAKRGEFRATLGDDLVFVGRRSGAVGRLLVVVLRHSYTPCFRLAAMKSSRLPSSTPCVLPISTFVRRSLMRDWSST